jgi:non-ribosomal peptide synthetase component F
VASVPVFLSLTEIDHHPQLLALAGQARQVLEMTAEDLALIAFTSGSTGKPKAVEGRHGPLTHFLPWLQEYFSLGVTDRFSMLSGLAHDPLQRDMFTTFCVGATLHIPHPDVIFPERLAEWMQQQAVTVTHLTPAMAQILSEAPAGFALRDLRYVFLVGDVLTRRDVQRLRDLAPTMNVINYYGSTETQRSVSYYEVSRETASQTSREVIPLGRGIPDVQLLVLNAAGNLAGIGEHGEVYVRSAHMARGYRGDPELTAQKFYVILLAKRLATVCIALEIWGAICPMAWLNAWGVLIRRSSCVASASNWDISNPYLGNIRQFKKQWWLFVAMLAGKNAWWRIFWQKTMRSTAVRRRRRICGNSCVSNCRITCCRQPLFSSINYL